MQVTGTIKFIGQTEVISDSFKKRDIVIITNEQYPQPLIIQFVQGKCDALNQFHQGQNVTININLRGKEYPDKQTGQMKYFNTIQGWQINLQGQQQGQGMGQTNSPQSLQQPNQGYQQQNQGYQQANQGFSQQQNGFQQQQNNYQQNSQQPDLPF